jgi:hypothetical protein
LAKDKKAPETASDPDIAVVLANAIPTSLGEPHSPGDIVTLPADEARELIRSGGATRA